MTNSIGERAPSMKKRHSLLLANQDDHWFNARPSVMKTYVTEFGDRFCIVLWRNGPTDDAYILPYGRVKSLFIDENLTAHIGRFRWHGGIKDGILTLRGIPGSLDVADCHNAFHHLE